MVSCKELTDIIRQRGHIADKEDQFIFLASRKCGTQSVCRYLLRDRVILRKDNPKEHRIKMLGYSDDDVLRIFKFTIVRNPWERVVSAFHALQQYSPRIVPRDIDFKTFTTDVLAKIGPLYNVHFQEQHTQIVYKGEMIVDFIASLENINRDWSRIAPGIKAPEDFPHENRSKHDHYRKYYDNETKEIIDSLYKEDIQLLGYEF